MGQVKKRGQVWWVRYYRDGRRFEESARSTKRDDAVRLLRVREGDIAKGMPVTPKIGRLRFDDAVQDVVNDYEANGRRSQRHLESRIEHHLKPYFTGRRMSAITTSDVRAYITQRQKETVFARGASDIEMPDGSIKHVPEQRRATSNGAINRELTILKRAFSLAVQAGKLLVRPHIPILREDNVRTGFFEADQLCDVLGHLPKYLTPVVRFAYLTGWRIASEVLPLQWRHIDFAGGEIRLDAGTTKNDEGRVFPITTELSALLEGQRVATAALAKRGVLCPHVFQRNGRPIKSLIKAWRDACRRAGCPGRIQHDLRRTAVRNFVRAGVPERVAMKLTGHKTRSVFDRYNIVSESDLRAALTLLDNRPSRIGSA
jgi:integrase